MNELPATAPSSGQTVANVRPSTRPASQPADSGALAEPTTAPSFRTSTNLGKVLVTADLDATRDQIAPSLGAVTYTIGQNQIQSTPQGDNASFNQVLLRSPGVVLDSFGEEHVRGEHGDLTYRVNGVLLPEGLNGFGQELDTRLINSVTLIDGTLPAQFGFRTAGIVDVTTKSGDTLAHNELSLYGGSYNTFQPSIQVGGTKGNLDYFVTGSFKQNDLGIENPTASFRPIHDDTSQTKAFAYLSYRLDPTSRLSLLLSASNADFQLPDVPGLPMRYSLADVASGDSSKINENQNEQNYYAVLSYQKTVGDLSFQLSPYTRYGQIRFTPDRNNDLIFQGTSGQVKNAFITNGVQFDAAYALNDRHTVRGGFLAQYTRETLDTDTAVFPAAPLTPSQPSPSSPIQTSDHAFNIGDNSGNWGIEAGIYLQDEWHLTDNLTLNYGFRYDWFDASFENAGQLSPRLNLVWKIDEATTAHAGYSRYFTPPSVQYVPPGTIAKFASTTNEPQNFTDDPTPVERSNYYDIGLQRRILPNWQVTVDGFYKQARNLIDLGQFGQAVILSPFSYRRGTVYGGELSSTYSSGSWSWFGNFSYVNTSARDINSSQYQFPNDELSYISTHNIKLDHEGEYGATTGLTYTWKDNRAYIDFLYGYGLRAGFANLQKEPSYYPVNIGYEHIFRLGGAEGNAVKFRVDVVNLFDETYQLRNGTGIGISASQYGQRRSIFLSMSYEF